MESTTFSRWIEDSVSEISTLSYKHETEQLQKHLKDVQSELSAFRQRIKNYNFPSFDQRTPNHMSICNPPSSEFSCELSGEDYSMSSCDDTGRADLAFISRISNIPNVTDSSIRQRNSHSNIKAALHSTLLYPQFSTPRRNNANKVQYNDYSSDCVCQLVFEEGTDITIVEDDNSLLDSGYSSNEPRDTSAESNNENCPKHVTDNSSAESSNEDFLKYTTDNSSAFNSTVNSDDTTFFETPLTRPAVTRKPSHRSIAKQLKQIRKKIQKQSIDQVMNTLAVL